VVGGLLSDGAAAAATREAASTAAGGLTTTAARDATSTAEDAAAVCRVNSFTGNTKVLLPGSKTIAISKVKAGQKVLATDPYTGKTAARQVAQVIKHHGVHAMALIAPLGGGLIHATAHHPIYDASTKTFTYAASLHPGDKLLEPSGSTIKITSIRDYTADLTAYNLNVTSIHTYYVTAGTVPVLVHNSCGPALEGRINPATIRFSQDSATFRFSNGSYISDVARRLREGNIEPESFPPIRLVQRDNNLFTLDNRRLVAFQMAGVDVPFRMATEEEIGREAFKFTTQNGGREIQLALFGRRGF